MTTGSAERMAADEKRALRTELLAARARLAQDDRARRSVAIAARIGDVPVLRDARTIALYAPLGSEVDSGGIARRLLARGARVLYPRSVAGERRLLFCECDPAELVRGPLGAREPPPSAPSVDLADVDCVVLPGVAFSLDGHRLGRGGGYYDATLAAMPRAGRVGVAFDIQVVPSLPREVHDAPLDAIVTDARVLLFPRAPR